MQHHRLDVGGRQLAGPARDLGVAEPVEREPRLPPPVLVPGEDHDVGGPGSAQRPGSQLACVEHLGMADGDLRPGVGVRKAKAHPPDHVDPEVDQQGAGW